MYYAFTRIILLVTELESKVRHDLHLESLRLLKDNEREYKFTIELSPVGIVNMNMKGIVTSVNAALLEGTGYSEHEIVGKHFTKLKFFRAQDIPKFLKLYGLILRRRTPKKFQYAFIHRDGTLHQCEAFVSLLEAGGKRAGIQAMCIDTTVIRQAEQNMREMLAKQKLLNEKLNVISQLTRHNIRNKLSAITGNIYLGKKQLAAGHKALEYIDKIESSCSQIVRILNFAGVYEMLGVEEAAHADVERTLEEAVSLFPDLKGMRIVNRCKGLVVLADSLLRLVFYHLIDNTIKYGRNVSQIVVYYEEADADKLRLVYKDNGCGIPPGEKSELFSKGYVKGSGFGLYLVKEIMKVYGWTIKETGKSRQGARFTITIPKANRKGRINYRLLGSENTELGVLHELEGQQLTHPTRWLSPSSNASSQRTAKGKCND
jgi:PAS domain S-box-containing protein